MMMTLTENPIDHRFLEWCCCSVATGLAIASSVTRGTTTRRTKHIEYGLPRFNSCRTRNHPLKIRPLRIQAHQFNRGGTIYQLSKTSSSLEICASAFNSTCSRTQTEPRTSRQRQTSTTILSPFRKETSKPPSLDDGGGIGGGDDGGWKFEFFRGDDGQPSGGGGGDWSGEFYIILFILFLALLRDRKEEKRIQKEEEDRRM